VLTDSSGICDVRTWAPLLVAILFVEFFRRMDLALDAYLTNLRSFAIACNSNGHWSKIPEAVATKVVPWLTQAFYFAWMLAWLLYGWALSH
jgi:hypothetical protein